jgi:hypothetical protein
MSVSLDDVRRIAALARLTVDDDRATALTAQLNGILAHMDVLQQVPALDHDPVDDLPGMPLAPDAGPPVPAGGTPVVMKDNIATLDAAHDLRVAHPRGLRQSLRGHGGDPAARGRGADRRQDEHGRVRHGLVHRALGVRADAQPDGPRRACPAARPAGRRPRSRRASSPIASAPRPAARCASPQRSAASWASSPRTAASRASASSPSRRRSTRSASSAPPCTTPPAACRSSPATTRTTPPSATCPPMSAPGARSASTGSSSACRASTSPPSLDPGVRARCDRALDALRASAPGARGLAAAHRLRHPDLLHHRAGRGSSNLARFDGVRYGRRRRGPTMSCADLRASRAPRASAPRSAPHPARDLRALAGYYDAYYRKAQAVRAHDRDDFDPQVFAAACTCCSRRPPRRRPSRSARSPTPYEMYLSDIFTVTANLAGCPPCRVPIGRATACPWAVSSSRRTSARPTMFSRRRRLEQAARGGGA